MDRICGQPRYQHDLEQSRGRKSCRLGQELRSHSPSKMHPSGPPPSQKVFHLAIAIDAHSDDEASGETEGPIDSDVHLDCRSGRVSSARGCAAASTMISLAKEVLILKRICNADKKISDVEAKLVVGCSDAVRYASRILR